MDQNFINRVASGLDFGQTVLQLVKNPPIGPMGSLPRQQEGVRVEDWQQSEGLTTVTEHMLFLRLQIMFGFPCPTFPVLLFSFSISEHVTAEFPKDPSLNHCSATVPKFLFTSQPILSK